MQCIDILCYLPGDYRNKAGIVSVKGHGRALARAVGRRPLTAEAGVPFWTSPIETCGGHSGSGTGTCLGPVLRFPPVSFIPPLLRNHSSICHLRYAILATEIRNTQDGDWPRHVAGTRGKKL